VPSMADSPPLRFACPYCDQHIECDLSWAGNDLNCPTCGKAILAPAEGCRAQPKLVLSEGNKAERHIPIRKQVCSEPVKGAPAWVEKAATYSVVAPITGACLATVLTKIPRVLGFPVAILSVLLMVSGGVVGVIVAFYWLRYRGKGLARALIGMCLSLSLVFSAILPAYQKAAAKYRELKQRQERKRGVGFRSSSTSKSSPGSSTISVSRLHGGRMSFPNAINTRQPLLRRSRLR
jgi:hypothetical protein